MPAPNTVPLLLCAIAFALGIGGATAGGEPWSITVGLGGGGLLLIGVGLWHTHRSLVNLGPLLQIVGLLVVVCALGAGRFLVWQAPHPESLRTVPDRLLNPPVEVQIAGTVENPVVTAGTATRFVLQADTVYTATDTLAIRDRIQVRWQPSPWADTLASFPNVEAGARWTMRGRLDHPPPPRNPADFDYGAYLQNNGIHWTLRVGTPNQVHRHVPAPPGYTRTVHRARNKVADYLESHLQNPTARSVQQALLLGDRSDISREHRMHFADTGLMHLLAVSGLHVLLVGLVVYQLLRPLLMRLNISRQRVDLIRAVCTVALLCTYMVLTGLRPSVVRATVMATILIGGHIAQRSYATLNALGAAALILLWMRPTALYDPGFQLSFAAVTGIVLFNSRLIEALPSVLTRGTLTSNITQLVTVSAAATLGTMPFLLVHFGFVSMAGLVLNVIAIPLTGLALAAGICTVVAGELAWIAELFGAAADVLTQALVHTASWGANYLEGWKWTVPYVPWSVAGGLAVVLCAVSAVRTFRTIHGMFALLGIGVCMIWLPLLTRPVTPTLDVLFFDVGQSDAALVHTPDGHHLLVDAGLRTPHFDAATSTLLPHLRYAGIRTVDAVAVSHPHADHIGGVPALLRAEAVQAVWDNGMHDESPLYAETVHLIDSLQISHRSITYGDTLMLGKHTRLVGFGPPQDPDVYGLHGPNEQSVVMGVQYGDVRMLFPGDAESVAESWLVDTHGEALQSDVVMAPHHGSSTSSTSSFVNAVAHDSTHVIISAGRYNQFGFPASDVVERWQNAGAMLHYTSDRAVWLRTDGHRVWTVDW